MKRKKQRVRQLQGRGTGYCQHFLDASFFMWDLCLCGALQKQTKTDQWLNLNCKGEEFTLILIFLQSP